MDARILQTQAHGVLIGARRFTAGDVHRVPGGAERRNEFAKRGVEVGGHRHQRQTVVHAGIGEQHAGAARAGDDHHVVALRCGQHGNAPREVEQVAQAARANDPGLLEHILVDLIVAASAPVCELAARAPKLVRPAFKTTMGFFLETRFATSAKERPSFRSSQCCAMIVVFSSCSKKVSKSSSSMSALLPSPTMAETPILAERENPMIAMPMPPDWEDSAA